MAAKQLNIAYVKHNLIDKNKWDECIENAANNLIYATSMYLDTMSKSWDALILNKYEAVMPLTFNKKFGINYLFQPFSCASLGIFGTDLSKDIINAFLHTIPPHFKYADIYLNYKNNFDLEEYNLSKRYNYVLSLDQPYDKIYSSYRNSYKQILLKNTNSNHLSIKRDISYEAIIELSAKKMKGVKPFKKDDIDNFTKLCNILLRNNQLKTYGVYGNSALLSSGIFFIDENRIYYIMAGNTSEGRRKGASHVLIDACIKDHCNTKLVFDFEGSNIPGIAFFFKGFAPVKEIYPRLKFNHLNKILKIIKH
ncbi:MAG: hypothetical protein ABIR81_04215 [Ginsengibacter sp.]